MAVNPVVMSTTYVKWTVVVATWQSLQYQLCQNHARGCQSCSNSYHACHIDGCGCHMDVHINTSHVNDSFCGCQTCGSYHHMRQMKGCGYHMAFAQILVVSILVPVVASYVPIITICSNGRVWLSHGPPRKRQSCHCHYTRPQAVQHQSPRTPKTGGRGRTTVMRTITSSTLACMAAGHVVIITCTPSRWV